MTTPLTIHATRCDDGKVAVVAAGEIDQSNVAHFDQALAAATTEAAISGGTFTVDLLGVEYLDSAAINALFTHAHHIHLIAHPVLIRILTVSGLTELATVEVGAPQAETRPQQLG